MKFTLVTGILLCSLCLNAQSWKAGLSANLFSYGLNNASSKEVFSGSNKVSIESKSSVLTWGLGVNGEREIKRRELVFVMGAHYHFSLIKEIYDQFGVAYSSQLQLHQAVVPLGFNWMPYSIAGMKVGPCFGIELRALLGNQATLLATETGTTVFNDKANVTFRDSEMQLATLPYLGIMVDSGTLDGFGWYYSISANNLLGNLIYDGFDIGLTSIDLKAGIWF